MSRVPSSIVIEHATFACAATHLAQTKSSDEKVTFWSCPVCGYASKEEEPRLAPALKVKPSPPPILPGIPPEMLAQHPRRSRRR